MLSLIACSALRSAAAMPCTSPAALYEPAFSSTGPSMIGAADVTCGT